MTGGRESSTERSLCTCWRWLHGPEWCGRWGLRAVCIGGCSVAGPWQQGGYTFTCACGMPLSFGDVSETACV